MNYTLKNRLTECRAAKGINKSQLAIRLGKSRAYVTRLERGDVCPSATVMLCIARYFKKPVEEIFHLEEEKMKLSVALKGPDALTAESFPKSNFPFASATNGMGSDTPENKQTKGK